MIEPTQTGGSQFLISIGNEREVLDPVANGPVGRRQQSDAFRPTQRERYRVTIFGSARVPEDHLVYAAVRDVAEELTRMGCDIITGGGPGLMAAANEGTKRTNSSAHDRSVGIRVQLPLSRT